MSDKIAGTSNLKKDLLTKIRRTDSSDEREQAIDRAKLVDLRLDNDAKDLKMKKEEEQLEKLEVEDKLEKDIDELQKTERAKITNQVHEEHLQKKR